MALDGEEGHNWYLFSLRIAGTSCGKRGGKTRPDILCKASRVWVSYTSAQRAGVTTQKVVFVI